MTDAYIVHPERAFLEVEPDGIIPAATLRASAKDSVQIGGYVFAVGDIVRSWNDFDTPILFVRVNQRELDAYLESGHHHAWKGCGIAIPVPFLIVCSRQWDVRIKVRPDVVCPQRPFKELDQGGMLEYLRIDKGTLEWHPDVIAMIATPRILPLARDVAVSNRYPGLANPVNFLYTELSLQRQRSH